MGGFVFPEELAGEGFVGGEAAVSHVAEHAGVEEDFGLGDFGGGELGADVELVGGEAAGAGEVDAFAAEGVFVAAYVQFHVRAPGLG